jgi:hypothetical protein
MYRKYLALAAALLFLVSLAACSGGGSDAVAAGPTGAVSLSLTDGPGDYDHVWITIEDVWFHRSGNAGPLDAGWHRFPLKTAVTVDLAALSNGTVGNPIWDRIALPAGDYQQIRLRLAGTEDSLESSAASEGLTYNNEVVIGADQYPLRIPDAKHGIMVTGNFHVTENGHLRLALDFNIDDDVVEADRNGNTEYILKPVLVYFDLDDAGAIVSHITPTADIPAGRFVVKAEQVGPD